MLSPDLTEADFLVALQNYLPPGPAWSRDPSVKLTAYLRSIAASYARSHHRQRQLLTDAFPLTTEELLPEWEATCGLPDPCLGPEPLVSTRRAQLIARLTNPGGQSIQYFINYAAALGYTITHIYEYTPFKVGMTVGQPILGESWAHAWQVEASWLSTTHYFLVGADTAGNRLATFGDTTLQCELQRIKPGHTTLWFSMTDYPYDPTKTYLTAEDGVTILTDENGIPLEAA